VRTVAKELDQAGSAKNHQDDGMKQEGAEHPANKTACPHLLLARSTNQEKDSARSLPSGFSFTALSAE